MIMPKRAPRRVRFSSPAFLYIVIAISCVSADVAHAQTIWMRKGPIFHSEGRERKPVREGVVVEDNTYTASDAQGSSNKITWSTPPETLVVGQEVSLTIDSSTAPSPLILGHWGASDAGERDGAVGDGAAGSWPGSKAIPSFSSGRLVFKFKPGYSPSVSVFAGKWDDSSGSSNVSVTWKYEVAPAGFAAKAHVHLLTTLVDCDQRLKNTGPITVELNDTIVQTDSRGFADLDITPGPYKVRGESPGRDFEFVSQQGNALQLLPGGNGLASVQISGSQTLEVRMREKPENCKTTPCRDYGPTSDLTRDRINPQVGYLKDLFAGEEQDLEIPGFRIGDDANVAFENPGISVLSRRTTAEGALILHVKVAADASLGTGKVSVQNSNQCIGTSTVEVKTAPAPEPPREPGESKLTVRVIAVVPDVQVHRGGRPPDEFEEVKVGTILHQADEISCDPDGSATLEFRGGATTVVRFTTQLKIASYFSSEGIIHTEIQLKMGEISSRVNKSDGPKSDFRIKSGVHGTSVQGTVFTVRYDPKTQTGTTIDQEGVVLVTPDNPALAPVTLHTGQMVQVGVNAISAVGPSVSGPAGTLPGGAAPHLSGLWADDATPGALYRVLQAGNRIYWLVDGVSRKSFANMFIGEISGNTITGGWVDLPGSSVYSSGNMTLRIESNDRLVKVNANNAYNAQEWRRR